MKPLSTPGTFFLAAFLFASPLAFAQPKSAPSVPISAQETFALRKLSQEIEHNLADPRLMNAFIGIEIKSVKSGESIYHQNENKNFLPASNLKLVTSAAALGTFGPNFRYKTRLVTDGEIKKGVLKGNLIIRGSGDPTFGSPSMYPDKDPTYIFDLWADTLEEMGIEKIDGDIIADPDYFTPESYPDGWAIEDIPYYFATSSSGLSFADNAVSVTVTPGLQNGSKPLVELAPETEYLSINNSAVTRVPKTLTKTKDTSVTYTNTVKISREPGENTISVVGLIEKGSPNAHEQLSVENPPLYSATVFREILEYRGFTITGGTMTTSDLDEKIDYQDAETLCRYTSPPMKEIIRVLNHQSQNFYAEELIRTLGKETGNKGNWESGVTAVKQYLSSLGLDAGSITLHDGSGLSRMDLISPGQIVSLLRAMTLQEKIFPDFDSSLPVMGVSGTISERLRGTAAAGNVHAKTGFLTGIRCLSGYLRTKDDELLAFSFMMNNYTVPTHDINDLQDRLILALVNFSRK